MTQLTHLSMTRMRQLLSRGEVSPLELVTAHLERIDRLDAGLNAWVHVDAEGALRAAREMKTATGGRLAGIPVSIKSSISVRGFRWECGSKLRQGLMGTSDAPLVGRLRKAGAIPLGSTNVPEFLMAWETDNALYGRTANPWDPERTAGGSSGGESAAVAAGMSAGGVGSDGGGSIRVPSHFTGICGLKPTPGRIPATGHFPAAAGVLAPLGVVGPMARTVEDLRLLYEVMAGPDDGDPSSAPVPLAKTSAPALRQMRIGYFETDGRTPVAPEIRSALRRARAGLEDQGFTVEDFCPAGLDEIFDLWWNLFGRTVGILLEPIVQDRVGELSPALRQFRDWVKASPPLTRDGLMDTMAARDACRTRLLREMEAYPILLCPVAAVGAFRHGERRWVMGDRVVEYLEAWSYSAWFNLTGSPAIAVPVPDSGPLPVGVQLVGRPWSEDTLLGAASLLEGAVGTHPFPPLGPD